MKGIVFNVLEDMVESSLGLEAWDEILSATALSSGGSYTASATYDDEELLAIVGALSTKTGLPPERLVHDFGVHLLGAFAERYPMFFADVTVKQFLQNVGGIIHDEIRKLHPGAGVPDIGYEDPAPDRLVMLYRSPRRMCTLAEGLIRGSSGHFGVGIELTHPRCLHRGDDHCRLEILFAES